MPGTSPLLTSGKEKVAESCATTTSAYPKATRASDVIAPLHTTMRTPLNCINLRMRDVCAWMKEYFVSCGGSEKEVKSPSFDEFSRTRSLCSPALVATSRTAAIFLNTEILSPNASTGHDTSTVKMLAEMLSDSVTAKVGAKSSGDCCELRSTSHTASISEDGVKGFLIISVVALAARSGSFLALLMAFLNELSSTEVITLFTIPRSHKPAALTGSLADRQLYSAVVPIR
mmetsp:Transcript_12573/g.35054  ORF Transcript_12573/g.35054 Transcript_12573/m.35054 type:complete len:230 (+) Transcript_12573:1128-1817(+)